MNSEKLIAMVQQIMANQAISEPEKAACAAADHINKFWAPPMRSEIKAATAPQLEKGKALRLVISKIR